MKFRLIVLVSVFFLSGQASAGENPVLKSQKDKLSYSIGIDMGRTFKKQSINLDPDILARGIRDGISGEKALMTDQEMKESMGVFREEMMKVRQAALMKQLGEKNKKEGEAFLEENKKKEGVVTLPSGLQYKVINAGKGKKPQGTDTVRVNYRGTLINGNEFDSTYKRGKPEDLPLGKVIPGWNEALQQMQEGAKWEVFMPSNLAYGERSLPAKNIGPNATLVFEIELVSVQEKK